MLLEGGPCELREHCTGIWWIWAHLNGPIPYSSICSLFTATCTGLQPRELDFRDRGAMDGVQVPRGYIHVALGCPEGYASCTYLAS